MTLPVDADTGCLDQSQYSKPSILQYESVYGEDFVSPGGYKVAHELISQLSLDAGSRVLDVGCGLGGSAFLMAREFRFVVDGIDLSQNMLDLANTKLARNGLSDRVSLEHGDCLALDRNQHYDAIYSRDVFLHIEDKERLFYVLHSCLKPGGQLLFTDYCCGEKPWREDFSDYVKSRGYDLRTLSAYTRLIAAAGFIDVSCDDLTERFIQILNDDIDRIVDADFSGHNPTELAKSWHGKLDRASCGDHRWGLFRAIRQP